ncbi:exported hypothetical protein [Micromonospora lupini str. Lupac 08]|uniref:Uncharacterized protein n=1 Tax=Micromonospora lupini str. Lupac 08 TaxID=1150864 RepID=I0L0X1_9ACTN|nr:exported hypothetical protein [Micromonospora lupini str. Lupac 08]
MRVTPVTVVAAASASAAMTLPSRRIMKLSIH